MCPQDPFHALAQVAVALATGIEERSALIGG
jgi:hypothetical protein